MDYVSSKCTYTKTLTAQKDEGRGCTFASISCDSTVAAAAQSVLKALALMPDDTDFDYEGDYFYFNNGAAERSFYSGGYWNFGAFAGLFCLYGGNPRSHAYASIGFRSAFVKLPSA